VGFWDDLGDALEDVGDVIVDTVEGAIDTVGDVAEAAVDAVVTVATPVFDLGMHVLSPVFGIGEAVVGAISDPMAAIDAIGDVINDPVGAVESAFDSVVDYGLGLGEGLGGVIKGVGESAYGLAGDVLDTGLNIVGSAGGVIGDVVGAAGGLVDAATGGLASDALDFVDDEVFDRLDDWTEGVIDIDFDNGTFTANVGVDNVLQVGVGIGDDGLTATADVPLVSVDVGLTGSDGATVLLGENVPGWDAPFDAKIGAGVSDDGGVGFIAQAEVAGRPITVDLLGDYKADLTYDQVKALSGIERAASEPGSDVAGPGATDVADPGVDVLARETFAADVPVDESFAVDSPLADPLVQDLSAPMAPLEPEPQSDFEQAITSADDVESSFDSMFDDLG
jgi:hypothetical protein